MVGWTNFGIIGVFFCSGCDCKCYILLHMLGLVNKDSFSNNKLYYLHGAIFFNAKNIKSQELWTFEIEKLECNTNCN